MTDVDKIVKFLQEVKTFYIATIEDDQPRVRPFGVAENIEGKVSICTGYEKDVYKQIQKNPKVEISAMTDDGKWLRLYGSLFDNTTSSNQDKMIALAPHLRDIYKDINKFRVLSFKEVRAVIQNFSGYREEFELK
jgi:uncharacterized pyridoxamine 5'-phosphate oxidase family protein